jgi:hypothetical protein
MAPSTLLQGWQAPRLSAEAWLRNVLTAAGLFLVFFGMLAFVQYGTAHLADNDGFYHMRMAQLIRDEGLTPRFRWLPLTILDEKSFYDHHLLYHVYLALFTGNGSDAALITGAKLASVIMPALAFTAVWWLLRAAGVTWAWAWTLGLCAISEAFLYRMSLPRAQSASLLILALGLHWLIQRRYALMLPLGFIYVWLYNAFPLLLAVAGIVVAATWLTEQRLEWRAFVYPTAGIALGLVLNPYVPHNIAFIISHLLPKIGAPETNVGNEWYPYQTWTLVENSGGALLCWFLGVFTLGWRGKRFDRVTLATFGVSLAFGFLLLKSRRFVEYFPPFALIFTATVAGPLLTQTIERWSKRRRLAGLVVLSCGLAAMVWLSLCTARASLAQARPAETYAAAARWLQSNTPPESMVFQTDWDDFPRLFFYNTSNIYLNGLDPTYLQLRDPALYDEWVALTRGEVEKPGQRIRDRFDARYAISDLNHTAFIREAKRDPSIHEVYRDTYAVIFEVR